jgi:tripartite-type tricarboxylate transporter receptor subunit TctC
MKLPRRKFLHLAAGALPAVSRFAWAQGYPSRPVRIIVGFPAGGTADITVRLVGQWLSERIGQSLVIENRAGAGSNIATEAVVRATPDGYTLFWATSANAINATLYDKLNYNFIRDILPITGAIRFPNVMEVNPSIPAKRCRIHRLRQSQSGQDQLWIGGHRHHKSSLGRAVQDDSWSRHAPRSLSNAAPALTDLLGGQVQVMIDNMPSSIEYIRAGRLRPLAVTTRERSGALPDIPTVSDFLPGYEAGVWFGLGAPKNTPAEIFGKLNQEINAALADPNMKARLTDLGGMVLAGSPADFGKLIADETEKWGKVVKFTGAKAD